MIEICSIKIVIALKICCPCIQTKLKIIIYNKLTKILLLLNN